MPAGVAGAWLAVLSGETHAAAPTGILLSSNTVMENSPEDAFVGYLSAVDSDPGEPHVFSLVEGEGDGDNRSFWILGNELRSYNAGKRDYEAGDLSFHVRVRATDSAELSHEREFALELTNDRSEDVDRDGMTEAEEEDVHGTSDELFDTDGDGVGDALELAAGTSPLDPGEWPQVPIMGWGKADRGEQAVPAGGEYAALATGQNHSLAMAAGGGIAAWGGYDSYGQTELPPELTGVVALAAGGDYWLEDSAHSVVLKSDGTVEVWGFERNGLMKPPEGLGQVIAVGAGRSHSIALKRDATVVTWGHNPFGEVAPPDGLADVVAVAARGFYSMALKGDGTVVAWGSYFDGTGWTDVRVPVGLDDVVGISAGRFHHLALKGDGTVVAWGYNENGQTEVPAGLEGVVAVAAGGFHNLALRHDGTVVAWGYDSYGQSTVPVAARNDISLISAGLLHSLAVRRNENAPAIVSSRRILAEPGAPMAHQVVVANPGSAGLVFSAIGLPPGLAIDPVTGLISGTVAQPTRRSVRIQVETGPQILTQLAWLGTSQGLPPTAVTLTPAEIRENSPAGTLVGTLVVADPDAGDTHTFEWVEGEGSEDNGMFRIEGDQLILDRVVDRDFEQNPAGFSIRVRARDASLNPFEQVIPLLFLDDRTEDADGDGLTEQQEEDLYFTSDTKQDTDGDGFGDRFEVDRGFPAAEPLVFPTGRLLVEWGEAGEVGEVRIAPPVNASGFIDISAGGLHSLGLRSDGTVAAWGGNDDGQADIPDNLQDVIAVEAGARHSLALKKDGTVSAWGFNDFGQSGVPGDLTGVVAISAGGYHSLALKDDGTVVAWGLEFGGATAVPENLDGVIAISAGGYHGLALRHDGTVVAWGHDGQSQASPPADLENVSDISAGWQHSLALKADGTVIAWGVNEDGPIGVPMEAAHVRRISAGSGHNLAIRDEAGFPGFADVSPIRGWPGETVARTLALENAAPSGQGAGAFSEMRLPDELQFDPVSGLISGMVSIGQRRAVRFSADTDQGPLNRVIWLDTVGGVAPTWIELSANPVAENSPAGILVGTLSVVDPNAGDSHSFILETLPEAPDSFRFLISEAGLVTRFPVNVDFDSGITELNIRVVAVDSGNNRFARDFVLQLTDDRSEDSDGDGVIEAMEEDVFGTSDGTADDLATADADRDGIPGLIEYAFNLAPKVAGPPLRLIAGAGSTAGLPAIDRVSDGLGNHRLRIEYLRRVGDEMVYTPQFGGGLSAGDWEAAAEPAVTPVDAEWERCVVVDTLAPAGAPRRFGRVAVRYLGAAGDRSLDRDGDGVSQAMEEDVFGTSDAVMNDFRTEDLDGDGVPGMIEYAFNLEPRVSGPPLRLVPGAGSMAGLPAITLVEDGGGNVRLRLEYLRRVGGILSYVPQFAGGLDAAEWAAAGNPLTVSPIDGVWERCVVEDTQAVTGSSRRFARVAVSW